MMRRSASFLGCVLWFAGCASGNGDQPPEPPTAPSNEVVSVSLSTKTISLTGTGATATLEATVTGASGVIANPAVTWSSSANAVVTVSGSGRSAQLVAVSVGTATVTATSGSRSDVANVTVSEAPRTLTVTLGGAGTGRVTSVPGGITCSSGSSANCQSAFAFGTSVVLTATANTGSAFEGWNGSCNGASLTCTVTLDAARTAQAGFRLLPLPVATLTVTPASPSVDAGETVLLTAVARAADATILTDRVVTWSSTDTTLAVVSPTGLVTAKHRADTVRITATSEGISASALVTVRTPYITATAIATGYRHSCAIERAGVTWCWGYDVNGELGAGPFVTHNRTPVRVASDLPFTGIVAGGYSTCALTKESAAYCWGYNSQGQLGNGTTLSMNAPSRVVGDRFFTSIAHGGEQVCGLTANGSAYCWGNNYPSRVGTTSTADFLTTPTLVTGGLSFTEITVAWTASGGAFRHSICGIAAQRAYCWGNNYYSQLGDSSRINRTTPTPVHGRLAFSRTAIGHGHACGLLTDGGVRCWGRSEHGQLGIGQFMSDSWYTTPAPRVWVGEPLVSLTAGETFTCGLTASGAAWCWGNNQYGQLGDGTTTSRAVPVAVDGPRFTVISAGWHHACGLGLDQRVYCWGRNADAQLGMPASSGAISRPTPVARP